MRGWRRLGLRNSAVLTPRHYFRTSAVRPLDLHFSAAPAPLPATPPRSWREKARAFRLSRLHALLHAITQMGLVRHRAQDDQEADVEAAAGAQDGVAQTNARPHCQDRGMVESDAQRVPEDCCGLEIGTSGPLQAIGGSSMNPPPHATTCLGFPLANAGHDTRACRHIWGTRPSPTR